MSKKKKETGFDEIIEYLYLFLRHKLHFDDFQASTLIVSIIFLPITYFLGFGTSSMASFTIVFYLTLLIDFSCVVYSVIKFKNRKNLIKKSEIEIKNDERIINKITSIEEVNELSGIQFEKFIEKIFKDKGYKTTLTKASYDAGIDIVAEKGTEAIGIQAKKRSKSVNRYAVFDAHYGLKRYNCTKACVATNSVLTEQARNFALENNVDIMDKFVILSILRKKGKE